MKLIKLIVFRLLSFTKPERQCARAHIFKTVPLSISERISSKQNVEKTLVWVRHLCLLFFFPFFTLLVLFSLRDLNELPVFWLRKWPGVCLWKKGGGLPRWQSTLRAKTGARFIAVRRALPFTASVSKRCKHGHPPMAHYMIYYYEERGPRSALGRGLLSVCRKGERAHPFFTVLALLFLKQLGSRTVLFFQRLKSANWSTDEI